ncbi:alkene reductase [Gramella sp. GC03-9]|uniref:Alkene reductase n=1 Tax=Christiangramia oceanisediminis TaxID=2920386 RepID=A0A9X2KVK7_9FLAO|nr:alkene reductase [Gramella oceanisediminis]MCP9198810.1 alkene reductase [Gramella oceanisediminis]
MILLSDYSLNDLHLDNRMVLAPLTRARAYDNIPNDLMVEYYTQRSGAGLIISEGTAPSPNGLGYARIPGIYSEKQIEGWKKITRAVHEKGSKIFLQIMHTGRVSHALNMEKGTRILAPSAVALDGEMYTDQEGPKPYPVPEVMDVEDIKQAQEEFLQAARNAIKAGFDGVEIHSANGYLADQFLNTATNKRTNEYGGTIEKRSRFTLELAEMISKEIGKERTGIRLSPYSTFNGTEVFDEMEDQFLYLTRKLDNLGLSYIHLVNNTSLGSPAFESDLPEKIREAFNGTLILNGGYDKEKAEADLNENKANLISFGRTFIANPDLPYRFENDLGLNDPDYDTFYTPGEKGYIDYPFARKEEVLN